jgi:hypothetical protein
MDKPHKPVWELNDFALLKRNRHLIGAANQTLVPVQDKSCFVEAFSVTYRPSFAKDLQICLTRLDPLAA